MEDNTLYRKRAVLGAIYTVLFSFFSSIMPFCAVFAGASAAAVFINGVTPWLAIIISAVSLGLFYGGSLLFGTGIFYFALLALVFAITTALFVFLFKKAFPLKNIIVTVSITIGAALLGLAALYVYLRGGSISAEGIKTAFAWVFEKFDAVTATFLENVKALGNENIATVYEEAFKSIRESISEYYMPMIPSLLIYYGFIAVTPSALFLKNAVIGKCDVKKIGRLGAMRTERLFAILMAACYIATFFLQNDVLGLTVKNITLAASGYYIVAGYSFISFLMSARGAKTVTRYVVYAVSIVLCLMTFGLDVIAMLGILEGILQTRRRFDRVAASYGATGENIKELLDKFKEIENEDKKEDIPWYERNAADKKEDGEKEDKEENDGEDKK